jgi:hypothetical protein
MKLRLLFPEETMMDLKQRKETKILMTKIINAAKAIREDAHAFHLHDETFAQMHCLTIFVENAKVLMDTLKPQQPHDDDAVQGVLLDLDPEVLTVGKVIINPEEKEQHEGKETVPEDT